MTLCVVVFDRGELYTPNGVTKILKCFAETRVYFASKRGQPNDLSRAAPVLRFLSYGKFEF